MHRNCLLRTLTIATCSFLLSINPAAHAAPALPGEAGIVPKPVKLEMGQGTFLVSAKTRVLYDKAMPGAKDAAEFLANAWRADLRRPLKIQPGTAPQPGGILLTSYGARPKLGDEGYELEVKRDGITITASAAAGLFYGVQTLRQLGPYNALANQRSGDIEAVNIPCLQIEDYPRFKWRGMHLDVSRRFFDVAFVKRYLDRLALHKINVFHWHLSDDDGWRIQIKKYPRLTEVGAWRGPKEKLPPSYDSGNERYGGFYTQAEAREIITYAAKLHIMIVPEIDVPAHSRAAIVAYPELICTGNPYQFKSAQEVTGNVLCPSQEITYQFLEGVLGELAELFPGPYFHVGGDERPKGPWEQCERCQKRQKDEHLPDMRFLQDRFLKRLQVFLRSRGKTMVGWDELEQESILGKSYVVMAWQSVKAGIAAAEKGYPVVMAPSPYTYFDFAYSEDKAEPGQRWGGTISLEKAYSYDPRPADLPPAVSQRILGVEGCLWSEMLAAPGRADYMAYPRVCALAEVAWTPQAERDWSDFWDRMDLRHLRRLDAMGVAYRLPPPTVQQSGSRVTVIPPYEGAAVNYTTDGSEPQSNSARYDRPKDLPPGAVLKARTFHGTSRGSRTVSSAPAPKSTP